MSREFSVKLLERVLTIFLLAFASTWISGSVSVAFHSATPLSVAQRALIAGVAATTQLLIGTLIGPHVGNPQSPGILPKWALRRLGSPVPSTAQQLVVTLDDIVGATLREVAVRHPEVLDVKAEDVVKQVLASRAVKNPQPPQPPTSEPDAADIP